MHVTCPLVSSILMRPEVLQSASDDLNRAEEPDWFSGNAGGGCRSDEEAS